MNKREKEAKRSEHIQKQEKEVKLLTIIEVEEELKRAKRGMLNIQPYIGCKVVATFIIIFRMCRKEGI